MIWSKAASAETEFKRLKDGNTALLGHALLFLREARVRLSLLHSNAAADNNHLHTWQALSPACPPLRQSLSLGWPVRPGLGRLIRLKRWKKRYGAQHLPLKALLLKGHPAERSWGGPLLPALCLGSWVLPKGCGEQDQAGCSSRWEQGYIHADTSLGVQQVLNSQTSCKQAAPSDVFKKQTGFWVGLCLPSCTSITQF